MRKFVPALASWPFGTVLIVATVGAVLSFLGLLIQAVPNTGIDDANISMAYGRHLVEGLGFVYNPGGERVEGFTSLLHVLLIALLYQVTVLTGLPLELLLLAVSLAINSLALGWLSREMITTRSSWDGLGGGIVLVWCLVSPAYFLWSVLSLLDTGLFGALLLGFLASLGRGFKNDTRVSATLFAILLMLTRPESMVLVPAILVVWAFLAWRTYGIKTNAILRATVWPATATVLTAALLTAFRMAYFGVPLPNTYYAKVSSSLLHNISAGLDYFHIFLTQHPMAPWALVAVAWAFGQEVGLVKRPESRSGLHSLMVMILPVAVLIPILTGGDHFRGSRFFQPIWPLLGAVLAHQVLDLADSLKFPQPRRKTQLLVLGCLALFFTLHAPISWLNLRDLRLGTEWSIADRGRILGEALNRHFPGDKPRIGVVAAGGTRWTYQGPIFDLLGLNDFAMGHSSGDRKGKRNHSAFSKEVFFKRPPQLHLPVLVKAFENRLESPYLGDLHTDPQFLELFELVALRRQGEPEWILAYAQKTYRAELEASGQYEFADAN